MFLAAGKPGCCERCTCGGPGGHDEVDDGPPIMHGGPSSDRHKHNHCDDTITVIIIMILSIIESSITLSIGISISTRISIIIITIIISSITIMKSSSSSPTATTPVLSSAPQVANCPAYLCGQGIYCCRFWWHCFSQFVQQAEPCYLWRRAGECPMGMA